MTRRHQASITARGVLAALGLGFVVGLVATIAIGIYAGSTASPAIAIFLPAGLCGLVAFGAAIWRLTLGERPEDIQQSMKDAWDETDF